MRLQQVQQESQKRSDNGRQTQSNLGCDSPRPFATFASRKLFLGGHSHHFQRRTREGRIGIRPIQYVEQLPRCLPFREADAEQGSVSNNRSTSWLARSSSSPVQIGTQPHFQRLAFRRDPGAFTTLTIAAIRSSACPQLINLPAIVTLPELPPLLGNLSGCVAHFPPRFSLLP